MGELSALPNLGPVTEEQLNQVGIRTAEELRATGSREAWMRILLIDDSACYNRLCGIEGAIRGIPKKALPDETKAELKAFYDRAKGKPAK